MAEQTAPRRTRGRPNDVDVHVGTRVRQRRTLLGMSQEKLASALNLTFQQVQKYERGANRIGAGRLYELSRVLDVPVAFFYDGMQSSKSSMAEDASEYSADSSAATREAMILMRHFNKIREPDVRKRIIDLVKSLSAGDAA